MKIHLQIDRLVLDGFSLGAHEQARLRAALEQELGRLLGSGLALPSGAGGAVASVRGQPLRQARGADPAAMGRQLAASLYQEIGRRP
jgi:hypothetical protein